MLAHFHPTPDEFNSLSDLAIAKYFRWYQDKGEVLTMGFTIEKVGFLPHIGEQIHYMQDHDPQWEKFFMNHKRFDAHRERLPAQEALSLAIWERMKELLEDSTA